MRDIGIEARARAAGKGGNQREQRGGRQNQRSGQGDPMPMKGACKEAGADQPLPAVQAQLGQGVGQVQRKFMGRGVPNRIRIISIHRPVEVMRGRAV